jgi:hypothetical protein
VFFPAFDLGEWKIIERIEQEADEQNRFPFTYYALASNKNFSPNHLIQL